jgi:hypothetical protein
MFDSREKRNRYSHNAIFSGEHYMDTWVYIINSMYQVLVGLMDVQKVIYIQI